MQYINEHIEEEVYNKMFDSIKSILGSYQEDFDFNGDNRLLDYVVYKILDKIFDIVADYDRYEYDPDATDL